MNENAFLLRFSAPMKIMSRFGQPDKHHLNATAPQVKTTFPQYIVDALSVSVWDWIWSHFVFHSAQS